MGQCRMTPCVTGTSFLSPRSILELLVPCEAGELTCTADPEIMLVVLTLPLGARNWYATPHRPRVGCILGAP